MKSKFKIILWWSFLIIYLEIIYKFFIMKDLLTTNTFSVVLFSIPWIIIFTIITSIFNEKVNKILTIVFSFLIVLITLAQIVYYNFYNSMFSFLSLTTGTGQVMQFYVMIASVIARIWYIFAIILIPYILFLIFKNKLFNFKKNNLKFLISYLLIFILSFLGIILVINKNNEGFYSLKRLIFKTHAPMLTIDKTGLFTMEMIDIERYIFGFNEEIYSEQINVNNEEEKVPEVKTEYNTTDIDFDKLINDETDDKIKSMHVYFKNTDPSNKNEYTGMFKDKNLIFITAEAFDTIAIDEKLTPTLYKIANNSFIFKNYYQPLYPVSTSDGEYMNLNSLIPKEGVWSFKQTSKISMPYGIGNMFNKEGYVSYGFHNHNYNYYDRQKSHKNIGLKYYGCGNGLEKKMNCKHWPNSDKEMIDATTSYYIDKDKFMTYYMTVSGHLNYNFSGNNMAYRNKNKVKNLKYSTAIKAYLATQIELDKSIEKLLQVLEEKGKLNDTLIVIAPDHYPYGLTTKQMNEISTIDRNDKFEKFHTTLIMYNPNIEKTVVDKVISSLDILPTIYNLYGLTFDSRLLMGRDIFSNNEHIVILSDRSWITDKGKYNSVTKEFTSTTNEEIEEDYIDRINMIVNQRYGMSSLIIDNNYYKKIGIE
ncbi:MAG: sulfatase-like hydrolase/transferase [Clostridium sp.]|nr:sulfatase-like hydrolase/transferase [Clostridium sp.]